MILVTQVYLNINPQLFVTQIWHFLLKRINDYKLMQY